MKIDISKIDQERFYINERSIPGLGDFILVVPHKAMWSWQKEELDFRSLMCRPDGTVVSAGYPKFFNFGENSENDDIVKTGLADKRTIFTEKVDGSLIIRSVIDGKVHFRTRGCEIIAEDLREDVERLIRDRYSKLLDPELHRPEHSMLLEFISPKNQIIIRYADTDLIHLGWSFFGLGKLKIFPPAQEAYKHGVMLEFPKPVKIIEANFSVEELRTNVQTWNHQEGVVTCTKLKNGEIRLCKFKSTWYLRLHALKAQTNEKSLREFCYTNKISTLDQLKEAFYKEGFDWEIVSYIEPMFLEVRNNIVAVEKRFEFIDAVIDEAKLKFLPSRKEMALKSKELANIHGKDLFGYIISKSVGEEVIDIVDAAKMNMTLTQFRHFKNTGLEKLGHGKVIDDS